MSTKLHAVITKTVNGIGTDTQSRPEPSELAALRLQLQLCENFQRFFSEDGQHAEAEAVLKTIGALRRAIRQLEIAAGLRCPQCGAVLVAGETVMCNACIEESREAAADKAALLMELHF